METNRIALYQGLKEDEEYNKSFSEFIEQYFSNSSEVNVLYNLLIDNGDYTKTLKDFYKKYVCDLEWAKTTDYCKVTTTQTTAQPQVEEEIFNELIELNYDNYTDNEGKTYYALVVGEGDNLKSLHLYPKGKVIAYNNKSKKIGEGKYFVDGALQQMRITGIDGVDVVKIENQTESYKTYLANQEKYLKQQKEKEAKDLELKTQAELQKTPKQNLDSYSRGAGFSNWEDELQIEERVDKILELLSKGSKSNVFYFFAKALEYAKEIYPNRNEFYNEQIEKLNAQNALNSRNASDEDVELGNFVKIDLSKTGLWSEGKYYYYKPFSTKETVSKTNVIKQYTNQGWQDRGGKPLSQNEVNEFDTIDLKDVEPSVFKDSYILVKNIIDIPTEDVIEEIGRYEMTGNLTVKNCKRIIGGYHTLFKKEKNGERIPISNAELIKFKNAVKNCDVKHKNFFDFNITNTKLNNLKNQTDSNLRLSLVGKTQVADSYQNLKTTIKENLILEKQKKLIHETKVVEDRLQFVIESVGLKNQKDIDRIVEGVFYEMLYLESNNYNREIITENIQAIFDVLGTLFGGTKNGVISTFKEKGIDFILGKLGLDKNSYMGDFLAVVFGNVDLKDVPRLFTDCDFLTKKIAEAVPEAYLKNLQDEKGYDNIFMDYVRNTLYDVIVQSDIVQKLEERIAGMVCPITAGLTSKFEDKLTDMKSSLSQD